MCIRDRFNDIQVSKNSFACDIELAKKPEFQLSELKFDVPKPAVETDIEALTEKSLYNLRMRVGEVVPYEENDFVDNGDQITFSFTATIDGESFDGSVVEGEMYSVGTNRWTGFDQNLIGMKAAETRDFEFGFADGQLMGKVANFSVTVHMGTKHKPHPLDETFFQVMGVQDLEELMNKIRAISKASINKNERDAIRSQVALKLLDSNQFDLPPFITEGEAKYLSAQAGLVFDQQSEAEKQKYLDQAEKNSRLSLILDSVRESEPDSVLNEMEARNVLIQHLQASGSDPNKVLANQGMAAMLLNSIKDEFTLQWVADQANLIE